MKSEELFTKAEDCINSDDYEGAFELANQLTGEPWRSSAFKLLVDLFLTPRFSQKFGEGILDLAYLFTKNDIQEPSMRAKCLLDISTMAEQHQNWDVHRKASRQAVFEVFYPDC